MEELKVAYEKFLNLSTGAKIVFLILSTLIIIYFISVSIKGGDFASYMEAAGKMLNGTNIYDPPYVHLRYSYSPFWAMILTPFALLPSAVVIFIWLVLNVFLLWRTIVLLRNYFDIRFINTKMDAILWFAILLYMSRFIELNFHHSQMTIFLLWLILESIRLWDTNRETVAGILVGLGSIIKIMPIVMVPYLIYRRKFKAAFASIFTILIAFFLPIVFVGYSRFCELNKSWLQILRPDSSEFQIDAVWSFPQNLSALLYKVLMKTDAPYMKNIFSLDYATATKCIWGIIVLLIVLTIYFLATRPFQAVKTKSHIIYEISYIALIIPLIFPHQMKYAFYFLLPAICCLVKSIMYSYHVGDKGIHFKLTVVFFVISFILCTMTTDLILGMHYSIITQHLKTITIGTLLLIPALALNKRYFVL